MIWITAVAGAAMGVSSAGTISPFYERIPRPKRFCRVRKCGLLFKRWWVEFGWQYYGDRLIWDGRDHDVSKLYKHKDEAIAAAVALCLQHAYTYTGETE